MAKTTSTSANSNSASSSNGSANGAASGPRLNVLKTYKMYIGGKFPRTESGRYDTLSNSKGELLANICRGSRKDFRNAVGVARKAQGSWAGKSALLRGQILYRIAEMLEGRRAQFVDELQVQGQTAAQANKEVDAAIDRMVYYAGWSDKYQQVFSAVNPVASSHFNFSMQEATGVVSVFAPEESGLLGLVSVIAPIIVGGNTCVALASSKFPLTAITFAEVLNSSDVPGGVVNLITGRRSELLEHFSTHMDVNAMVYAGNEKEEIVQIQQNSTHNIKRTLFNKTEDWYADSAQNPYLILETQEVKTTWHPVGI